MAEVYEEEAAEAVSNANAANGWCRDFYEERASDLVSKANEARTAA